MEHYKIPKLINDSTVSKSGNKLIEINDLYQVVNILLPKM